MSIRKPQKQFKELMEKNGFRNIKFWGMGEAHLVSLALDQDFDIRIEGFSDNFEQLANEMFEKVKELVPGVSDYKYGGHYKKSTNNWGPFIYFTVPKDFYKN